MKKHILPSLCLGLLVAACNPPAPLWQPSDASPKPLKIDYVRLTHPAVFGPKAVKLSNDEADKLGEFIDSAQVTSDDHVYIEAPRDQLAAQRIGQLAHHLSEHGIGAKTLPAKADVPADQLLLVVERYVVTPPSNCPNWTKDPVANHENEVGSNFGCATVTNLGLMVADPRDLVIGRQMGPEEGGPGIAAVQRFRNGKVKPLPANATFTPGAAPTTTSGGGDAGGGATGQ
jgi:pilus assembly protein CpaD